MEFFHKGKTVRLCSHHEKYLVAEDDEESVRQDRNGASKRARWTVEFVTGSGSAIRLKSCYDKYLTASTEPFLKGLSSGRKVVQALPSCLDSTVEWEPIIDGEHIRLKSRYSHSFLRGSGGLAPWRNSVTHYTADETEKSSLEWDVDIDTMSHTQPPPPQTPQFVNCKTKSRYPSKVEAVRLCSHHEKYLLAQEDGETVRQDRNGVHKRDQWNVKFVTGCDSIIRLKSYYNKYLITSTEPFLKGLSSGQKVLQTLPSPPDSTA
ncbi:hypothetical protein FEM48_Zijuj07G0089200 [Ziziphus jujuba var. spinosa]|uniref:DUF569 domain-containing protein n=1 Tax=Ziziphus jujuba var. spinosa TaxID=714518 RepID=A0A978V3P5_ZIZJJ|nr:hypothetical protein FEM48_Zijuj07G0089200 [Ziziphus jujuba var. spinosa]